MFIGEASKASGATIKAIRLYEQMGLLTNIARVNSYRVFTDEDIYLIKFIKLANKFNFTLSELKELINPKDETVNWEKIRQEITNCLMAHDNCIFPETKN